MTDQDVAVVISQIERFAKYVPERLVPERFGGIRSESAHRIVPGKTVSRSGVKYVLGNLLGEKRRLPLRIGANQEAKKYP